MICWLGFPGWWTHDCSPHDPFLFWNLFWGRIFRELPSRIKRRLNFFSILTSEPRCSMDKHIDLCTPKRSFFHITMDNVDETFGLPNITLIRNRDIKLLTKTGLEKTFYWPWILLRKKHYNQHSSKPFIGKLYFLRMILKRCFSNPEEIALI